MWRVGIAERAYASNESERREPALVVCPAVACDAQGLDMALARDRRNMSASAMLRRRE